MQPLLGKTRVNTKSNFVVALLLDNLLRFWQTVGDMATLPIADTHRFIKRLKETGMPESQAQVLVEELQEMDLQHIASKADLVSLRSDLKQDIAALEVRMMKFVIAIVVAQIAVFAGIVKWF